MVFTRQLAPRIYTDYTRYRPQLRRDFHHRCAYCLTHEFYLGGEAGCEIDHHRPQRGPYARPDLISLYENLYWCCQECNQNKGDRWPSPDEAALGRRFLDPCLPHDDHELHWETRPDGTLHALTPVGEYTIEHLLLWREQLVYLRQRLAQWQESYQELCELLETRALPHEQRALLEQRLEDLRERIEPPVFHRAKKITAP